MINEQGLKPVQVIIHLPLSKMQSPVGSIWQPMLILALIHSFITHLPLKIISLVFCCISCPLQSYLMLDLKVFRRPAQICLLSY